METNIKPKPNSIKSSKRHLFRFLLLFFLAGMGIACLLIYLDRIGLFERWTYVNRVPDEPVELIGGNTWQAFIRTSGDKVLSCSAYGTDECWIPDVEIDLFPSKPCNKNHVALLPISNAPKNILSCLQMNGIIIEIGYEVIYAIDREGKLWRWEVSNHALEVILFPFLILAGGLAGTLIGSISWAIKEIALKKHLPERKGIPKEHLILLAKPWLCLLSIVIFWHFFLFRPSIPSNSENSEMNRVSTAVSGTVTVQKAELSKKWLVMVTPAAGIVRYDFINNFCNAKWVSGYHSVPCYEKNNSSGFLISKLSNPSIDRMVQTGDALWVRLTPEQHMVDGEFPTMEIQKGDHFRTIIGCLDSSKYCDLLFDATYEIQDKGKTHLGRWSLNENKKILEIELDLTKLASQKVRLYLSITDPNNTPNWQDIVLVNPRIEK